MKAVSYTRGASKQLSKLPAEVREALIAKVNRYAAIDAGKVKALKGQDDSRLRVGDYRLIFAETADEITVVAAGHRKHIYR